MLSVKESYLLARNFLGLFFHPFKTIRALFREKDYSQIILIFIFPVFLFFSGLSSIYIARRIFANQFDVTLGIWGWPTKIGIALTTLVSFSLFLYLFFWLYQVVRITRQK